MTPNEPHPFLHLPAGDLIARGLADLENGRNTIEALLVSIGGPRLRKLGLAIPERCRPEHELYELEAFMRKLGEETKEEVRVYFTGGATAISAPPRP
jgi:hypothetical protein